MKRSVGISRISLLVAMVIAGCTALPSARNSGDGPVILLQDGDPAEQAFIFHQRAQALGDEARRLEAEAAVRHIDGQEDASLS